MRTTSALPDTTLLRTTRYTEARDAVDRLSDNGFDVSRTAIVWNGLRRVERVTGRRTVRTAAGEGALAGGWFGLLVGALLAIFVDFDNAGEVVIMLASYIVLGAIFGAVWLGLGHWMTRGVRDFSATELIDAETFDVLVDRDHVSAARQILGDTTSPARTPASAVADGARPAGERSLPPPGQAPSQTTD